MSEPKFRDPRILAKVTVVLLGAQALALGWLIVSIAFRTWISDSDALWGLEERLVVAVDGAYWVTTIVFLAWFYRMHQNLPALGAPSSCGPGFAVVCWFIPLAGLWLPCKATEELWCSSDGEPSDDPDAPSPRRGLGLVWAWWGFFVARSISAAVSNVRPASSYETVNTIAIGANAVALTAAVLAILVVSRITRRQMTTVARSAPLVF